MRWRMSEQLNVSTRTLIILACSATAGVLLEFYDFTIFGYAAASAFPHTFFPNLAPTQALVFSYLTYGAGYPARLLGAFIFGHFGDRTGRKFARSEEHTSELQSRGLISYAVFCLKKKK